MPDSRTTTADRVSTPLLTLITQQSLDEDYRHVAERRAEQGSTPTGRRRLGTATVVVAVFGLLVTVAAVQNSQRAGVQSASRASLIANIDRGRADLAALQERIVDLRELDVSLQDNLDDVTAAAQGAQARVQRLGAVTGFGAVTGPGVRVTVDDGDHFTVRDRDLRPLVDGLWNAGAEAISINGQRLTARTPIRNSGAAIHVNFRPLSPPYVVLAIGDPRTLQADLMETTSGLTFRDTAAQLGFPWNMDNVDRLSLPAAPQRLIQLDWAVEGTAKENLVKRRKDTPP
ncbi:MULTISPECIES: DUF881 domain-containing protein [unclassified Nocardioides]|uniref:DUF881 domain-containing protein n=1 Tax=unclassified Nocardioides TaxID=2615069 RepID=UPI000057123C|nr:MULTISPECIES: DUF881 domain-containing protein [unclassified Nocardioides]ABL82220.1 protein of unknown function DUF881 [Nocardioides sp. JS614]